MNLKRVVGNVALAVMLVGIVGVLSGCYGIPKGTMKVVKTNGVQLQAEGAGIIKADDKTTTFRIKCGLCGFESGEITIPTPSAGNPYVLKWVCPKCGHRQTVTIQVLPAK